jgi:hypothetical protein
MSNDSNDPHTVKSFGQLKMLVNKFAGAEAHSSGAAFWTLVISRDHGGSSTRGVLEGLVNNEPGVVYGKLTNDEATETSAVVTVVVGRLDKLNAVFRLLRLDED